MIRNKIPLVCWCPPAHELHNLRPERKSEHLGIIIKKIQHFMMFDKHKKFIYVLSQKRRHNLLSKSFGRHKIFIDFCLRLLRRICDRKRNSDPSEYEFIISAPANNIVSLSPIGREALQRRHFSFPALFIA